MQNLIIENDGFVGDIKEISDYVDWGLLDFKIPKLWSGLHNRGEGISIMVIDSGISKHKDLEKNINFQLSLDAIANKDCADETGHGTAVAGIIAAEDTGYGIIGVAPRATIIPVKVLDGKNLLPSMECLKKALQYALDIKPDIVNLSLGSQAPLSAECERLLISLNENGIPVVCAIGNEGNNYDCYPGKYPFTISVASYKKDKNISIFSSKSDFVDFALPGEKVLTTALNNMYSCVSGTSYSAPFLCGIMAIILAYYKNKNKTIIVSELKQILADSAKDFGAIGKDSAYGYGIIDLEKVINKIKCN
jgi:minor extracellular protease Epr